MLCAIVTSALLLCIPVSDDDLYRLTAASTTAVATSSTYTQTYAYDLIGNFTNKSDVGNYSYSGTGIMVSGTIK